MGNYSKALEYYQRALNIQLKTQGEDHINTRTTYSNIGYVNNEMGNYSKALEYFQKSLSIQLKT